MIDFLLDPVTGDLDLTSRDIKLIEGTGESLRQRLYIRYNTWRGEWSYNTAFGTPYTQRLLISGVSQGQVDAEFIAQANLEPDVTAVRNLTSTYNPSTRSYQLQRLDVFVDQEPLSIIISEEANKFTYPAPTPAADLVFCQNKAGYVADDYINNRYFDTEME